MLHGKTSLPWLQIDFRPGNDFQPYYSYIRERVSRVTLLVSILALLYKSGAAPA